MRPTASIEGWDEAIAELELYRTVNRDTISPWTFEILAMIDSYKQQMADMGITTPEQFKAWYES